MREVKSQQCKPITSTGKKPGTRPVSQPMEQISFKNFLMIWASRSNTCKKTSATMSSANDLEQANFTKS